ncbi:MAG: antibiotic biosynthesis monooxygenase [Pseudomonadales bacterium]
MSFVLIIHEVDDYDVWKTGFDSAAQQRKEAGEIEFQVLRVEQSANRIVHFSKWQSNLKARQFFESEEISLLRQTLGVNQPEFVYLNELDAGLL